MEQGQILQLVAGLMVLILVLPTMWYVLRQQNALRNAAIWLALFAALGWGYHVLVEQPKLAASSAPASIQEPIMQPESGDSPIRNL